MCDSVQSSLFSERGELRLPAGIKRQLALFVGMGPGGSGALPDGRPVASHIPGWQQGTLQMATDEEGR